MSESYRFDEILVQIGGAAAAGDFGVDRWRPVGGGRKCFYYFFLIFFQDNGRRNFVTYKEKGRRNFVTYNEKV